MVSGVRSGGAGRPEYVRHRILAAAEHLVRTQGRTKTTVADIAQACSMSPSNVYRFFESKKAIAEAVADVEFCRQMEAALRIVKAKVSARGKMKALIVEMHRAARRRFVYETRMHELIKDAMAGQWPVAVLHWKKVHSICQGLIQQGLSEGLFQRQSVIGGATCTLNSVIALSHPQMVAEYSGTDASADAELMAEFIVGALGTDVGVTDD